MPRLYPIALVLAQAACSRGEAEPTADKPAAPASPADIDGAETTRPSSRYDLLGALATCEIRHRGLSIDLGTGSANARRSYSTRPLSDVEDVEREGATFGRVNTRRLSYEFWLDEPAEDVFLSLRIHAVTAKQVVGFIDDKRLGALRLTPKETKVITLPQLPSELPAGRHVVELRFAGGQRGQREPLAEIDWLRIGVPDEITTTYAAPTLRDVVSNVVLDARPKRSLALHAPSSVRCPLRAAPGAQLRLNLGFWGNGSGTAEIRVLRDGHAPAALIEQRVTGGSGATWTPVTVELDKFGSRVVALELRASQATRGGRVVFGEPMIARREDREPRIPRTRTVVVVVESALDRRLVPPWGPVRGQSALGQLVRESAAFSFYRVSSSVPAAVMASILTGLPPRAHALEDPSARLPEGARTLARMIKEASGRSAMFTGVPTTFATFGFDSGWDRYQAYSPIRDLPVTEPFLRASEWLDHELQGDPAMRLVVIHARGAHPPWDVSREEATRLRPTEYNGAIEPRRAGILLGALRSKHQKSQRRIGDDDWVRLRALEEAAMVKQDAGLAQIVTTLRQRNAWDDALVIFVGDVAPGEPPELPYDTVGSLAESRLLVPLLVKFPRGQLAGKEVASAVTPADITFTVLEALRLRPPEEIRGYDLFAAAAGNEPPGGRPLVATLGSRYATRLGSWLLSGESGRQPTLCDLSVDPACVTDVYSTRPIAARAAWQWTYETEASASSPSMRRFQREPASIDNETGSALTVWGDVF